MPQKSDNNNIPLEHIRHSYAHILAASVLELFPQAKLGVGPVIENGFYYDFDLGEKKFTENDLLTISKRMKEIIKRGNSFEAQQLTIQQARKFFQQNGQTYKVELIDDLSKYGTTVFEEIEDIKAGKKIGSSVSMVSLYKTGNFIDLCRGGHISSSKELHPEAFQITKMAGAYWRGNQNNPQMQRIYSAAFKTPQELINYLKNQEELQKRDHRKLGAQMDLFSFHDIAPGAVFWHPKGMIIWKELETIWRKKHEENGYQETSTPLLAKKDLWERSGHWQHYRENMFIFEIDKEQYALKAMNCPESTLIYSSRIRSYKDLPIRFSEIGRVHRNELSGVLGGLLRVRQFTQDDAHIYCRPEQILEEISQVLKLIIFFCKLFGFEPTFFLSTKPDNAMGDPHLWSKAEIALEEALKKNKVEYEINRGDGAFYGPKIDVQVSDVLGRAWQLGTTQLDFQMPERFDLSYTDDTGNKQRPVMIHRAIFGSFERFIGILLEHFGGALPLWLAPVQVALLSVNSGQNKIIQKIAKELRKNNIRVALFDNNETIGKKIRTCELEKIPYMAIVGPKEMKAKSLSIRTHKNGDKGKIKQTAFIKKLLAEINSLKK